MQDAFVLLTPFVKGGRGDFIPLSEIPHCPLCQGGAKNKDGASGFPLQILELLHLGDLKKSVI
jgi:hypothetical protein